MLTSPQCIHENETLVLERLPKRITGELHGKVGELPEGWGLQFQEGLDLGLLVGMVSIAFLASLLFAVLWSTLKGDLQGAFGVASYIITAVAAFVMLVQNRAGKVG